MIDATIWRRASLAIKYGHVKGRYALIPFLWGLIQS